jgi:PAS domain S-box-containing protein
MAGPREVVYRGSSEKSATQVAESLERHSEGYTVTAVTEPSAAREKLRTAALDCIVSEYRLTAEDGIEYLQRVRETHPDLPFVLYTDDGDEHVAADAISAGVTKYVPRDSSTDGHAALADAVTDAVEGADGTTGEQPERDRLEQILKIVPECVVELNRDGQFVYANERAEEVLGLEQTAVTGRTYNDPEWEIRDVEGNPIPDEQLPFQQVYSTAEPLYDYQHTIRWPDGSERILSVSGVPLFDDEGDVETVVFSLSDITEQKRREQGLERYRRMIESLDDIATIIEPDGTIKYVSPAVERVLGYKPDELIGEVGFGYQSPEGSEAVADAIEDVLDNPAEPRTVQTRFRRADGSWCWVESTLRNRLDDGVIDGILVSSRDISERKRQNQRLQRRTGQLSQLHEVTRSLLASETPAEVAATASEKAVEILDFELNGIHFYDDDAGGLAPVAVSDGSRELFGDVPVIDEGIAWKAYQTGEEQRYADINEADDVYDPESPVESEVHLPLGSRGVFIISSTEQDAFETADIELARVLAANTEAALARISKEKQLRAQERAVEQKNERLEEFTSIVSHDLRNPLNVAQTRAELLSRDHDSEHLEPLERSLDRMSKLISDTLTLAKQGDVVAETEPVQLRSLASDCWQTVSTGEAEIDIVDDITFEGDRDRLRHVFENLFQNAIEHAGPAPTVRVGSIDDDGFYVEDTGPGIPEDRRESVFDSGETSERGGTGFGLAIVERIADAHGWQVEAVAGKKGGARFEFTGVDQVGD